MMNGKLNFTALKFIFVVFLSHSGLAQAVDPGLLQAAQTMIANGKSIDALDLLTPLENEYAGDKEFDYLYGLALLDTGEAGAAVFAFQRVLAVDPNFAGARLELGRSYFDMGQMQRASREFRIVQSQSPPQRVSNVIDKYMAAIEARNLKSRKGWKGFLQLGLGTDSNVNNATSVNSFLGFALADESKETSSSVISTLGGVVYDYPLSVSSKLFTKASMNLRSNNEASKTSTVNYDFLAGYTQSFGTAGDLSLAIQLYTADVNGDFNNKGLNLTTQYSYSISSTNQINLFLRAGNIDYVADFDAKDVQQKIIGSSWAHVFSGKSRTSFVLAAFSGEDEAKQETSPYGRQYAGLRLSASYPVTHRFNLFATIGGTNSVYDGTFFQQTEERSDELRDFSIGSSWRVNKTWVLRGVLGQSSNTSTIDIFEYDKNIIMFTARSEFLP